MKKLLVVVGLLVGLAGAARGAVIASPVVPILNLQGRPLAGASVTIQLCLNAACTSTSAATTYSSFAGTTAFSGTVPATGLLQFYADPGVYYVQVSGGGVVRTFHLDLPASSTSDTMTYSALVGGDEGWLRQTAASTVTAIKSNLTATANPTANDDSGDGYAVGSFWLRTDTSPKKWYVCALATLGAAVWLDLSTGAVGAISDLNGETGSITFATSTSGTDFNLDITGSGGATPVFTFQLPTASASARGLVSTASQTLAGAKTFSDTLTGTLGAIINESGASGGDFRVETDNLTHAIYAKAADDIIGIGTSSPSSSYRMSVVGGSKAGLFVSSTGSTGIVSQSTSGVAVSGLVTSGSSTAVFGSAVDGIAGSFATSSDGANAVKVTSTNSLNVEPSLFVDNAGSGPSAYLKRTSLSLTEPHLFVEAATVSDAGPVIQAKAQSGDLFRGLDLNDVEVVNIYADGSIGLSDGAVATPVLAFKSDTDSGLYLASAGLVGMAVNGVARQTWSTSGSILVGTVTGTQSTTGALQTLSRNSATATTWGTKITLSNSADGGVPLHLNTNGTGDLVYGSEDDVQTYAVTKDGRTVGGDGNAANPAFSFLSDSTSGVYLIGANTLGLSAAGGERVRVTSTLVTITGEAKITGVSGDGTGSAVCVKADGNLGTCSDVVDASGNCTCG